MCWTCGGRGHQSSICPSKPKKVNEVANPDQGPDGSEKRVETHDAWLFPWNTHVPERSLQDSS
eukprot:1026524-Amphidinium_carterae.1